MALAAASPVSPGWPWGQSLSFKGNINENGVRHPEEVTEVQPTLMEGNGTEMLIKA